MGGQGQLRNHTEPSETRTQRLPNTQIWERDGGELRKHDSVTWWRWTAEAEDLRREREQGD